jgi:small-conductance mechanosensitive channel
VISISYDADNKLMPLFYPIYEFYWSTVIKGFVLLEPITNVLSFPLATIDGKPITFGKILVGLIFLFGGIYLSKLFIKLISRKVLHRFIDSEYAVHAVENFAFYIFIFFFAVVALEVANIPATAFSILGGVIAVSVGFGAKNIANDFISGLVIIIERPVKIGDIVNVDGVYGVIEDIGMRATRINTYQNKHIIVPNNTLVENNVHNLTHSSRRVRSEIKVGVHYSSDVDMVKKCLIEAAMENPKTLKSSDPVVIFDNFGDNALEFILVYEIKVVHAVDERLSNSFIRERIIEKLRNKGITIAYPQRDVHLYMKEGKSLSASSKS